MIPAALLKAAYANVEWELSVVLNVQTQPPVLQSVSAQPPRAPANKRCQLKVAATTIMWHTGVKYSLS